MCIWVCIDIFFIYMCVCLQERLCNMCRNCQQREYTARNKNSSVSIQCVSVRPYFVLAFMSVCATVFGAKLEMVVYLVCVVKGDKRRRGGWRRKGGAGVPHAEEISPF